MNKGRLGFGLLGRLYLQLHVWEGFLAVSMRLEAHVIK